MKNSKTKIQGKGNPVQYAGTIALTLDQTRVVTGSSLKANAVGCAGRFMTDPVALMAAGDIMEEIATSGLMYSDRAAAISELTRAWQLADCASID